MGKTSTQLESKANRKFEKKLDFYAKVKDAVSSLGAQKSISKKNKVRSRQKKLKAYDLSTLSAFLPELKAPRQPGPQDELKLNCKSRQKLILKESKQLSTVLSHPAFQLDPLAAIHQHLQSTQPVVEEKPKKKFINKNGSKKKGKKSKASSGPESMDM
ncbi:Ribosome biogenesis protein slx9-like [Quillaja saponaria]|uniref:Ribosome biogenesis protein slx9-like n=1 Tax=Quillaja saponaria TaxID=32244 RepID=A0AAD7M037_QUISA|nr:Ribosome biogenesis protein slx9-like [Quillaja saponaria]